MVFGEITTTAKVDYEVRGRRAQGARAVGARGACGASRSAACAPLRATCAHGMPCACGGAVGVSCLCADGPCLPAAPGTRRPSCARPASRSASTRRRRAWTATTARCWCTSRSSRPTSARVRRRRGTARGAGREGGQSTTHSSAVERAGSCAEAARFPPASRARALPRAAVVARGVNHHRQCAPSAGGGAEGARARGAGEARREGQTQNFAGKMDGYRTHAAEAPRSGRLGSFALAPHRDARD